MPRPILDLNACDAPGQIAPMLQDAAQRYYESGAELRSAWQDAFPEKCWTIVAKELEHAAANIEAKLEKLGY